jgi:E3 ubiquitin-protein ligase HUWE1
VKCQIENTFFFQFVDIPLALESTNTEKEASLDETKIGEILIQGLTEDMVTVLIRACVSMLGVPVDPDTLHATLRLCLRLTRDHKYAMMFAELKSTRMILNLTQSSGFNGFTPLVTLLLRHIIEDPCTLRHTMEKVSIFEVLCLSVYLFFFFFFNVPGMLCTDGPLTIVKIRK